MPWLCLLIAGILEILWAVGMKYSEGFTKLVPSVLTIIGMVLSVLFLSLAMKKIPLGTAYAIWTGIGAAGTAIAGMYLFAEPRDAIRVVSILFIMAGIVGLKMSS